MKTNDELAKHLRSILPEGTARVAKDDMNFIFDPIAIHEDVEAWLKAESLDFEIVPSETSDWYFRRKK
jgi:hypothetical protein